MALVPGKRTKDLQIRMLSTKMMPAVSVLIPMYLLFQWTRLYDTKIGHRPIGLHRQLFRAVRHVMRKTLGGPTFGRM